MIDFFVLAAVIFAAFIGLMLAGTIIHLLWCSIINSFRPRP
jgi:hypothetical protein